MIGECSLGVLKNRRGESGDLTHFGFCSFCVTMWEEHEKSLKNCVTNFMDDS
jgi:hypothetical protein